MQALSLSDKRLILGSLHLIIPPLNKTFFPSGATACPCSQCGLTHRTPSGLRLLPVCTPSRNGVMRASTAAAFLPSSPLEKSFSPQFLRSPSQALTRTHCSPLKISPSSWWDGRGLNSFMSSLNPGWIQADYKKKYRCQGSWNEGSGFPAQRICSSDHLDFVTQAVSICHLLDAPISFLRLIPSGYSLWFLFLHCRNCTAL